MNYEAPVQGYESWTDSELAVCAKSCIAELERRGVITPDGVPLPKPSLWRRVFGK